jgi:hypothetical protein
LRVGRSGSAAASLARFDFATTFAIEHQYLGQPRHRGDRTDYLHWLVAKQADGSGVVRHSRVMYLQRPPKEERTGTVSPDAGSVSAALFQPYFVLQEIRFHRRRSRGKNKPGPRTAEAPARRSNGGWPARTDEWGRTDSRWTNISALRCRRPDCLADDAVRSETVSRADLPAICD